MKTGASINQAWDEIVFENRHKEYGAYQIRKKYALRIFISMLIMSTVLALVLNYQRIIDLFTAKEEAPVVVEKKMTTVNLDQPPPITPNQPPPPKLDVPPPVKTIKYVAPKVTTEEVPDEDEMPTQDVLKQVETSTETQEGEENVVFTEPVQEVIEEKEEDKIFTVVEQQAEFPGGMEGLYKFLHKNIKFPASAQRMGVDGKVFIEYVVDRDGNISDIKVIKSLNPDCDKEAVRVVKMMPPWKPGKQNGKAVKSRFVLPITFKLEI